MMDELMPLLQEIWGNAGTLGKVAAGLTLAVRIFRLPFVQGLVPAKFKWDSLGEWTRKLIVFGFACAGACLVAYSTGASIGGAVIASVPILFGASVVAHKATKAVGVVYDKKLGSGKSPTYRPSPFRKAASLVVPIPKNPDA